MAGYKVQTTVFIEWSPVHRLLGSRPIVRSRETWIFLSSQVMLVCRQHWTLPSRMAATGPQGGKVCNMSSQDRDKMGLENSVANGPCCRKLPLGPGAASICHGGGDYRPGGAGQGLPSLFSGAASARTPVGFQRREEACGPAVSGTRSKDPKKSKRQRSQRQLIF